MYFLFFSVLWWDKKPNVRFGFEKIKTSRYFRENFSFHIESQIFFNGVLFIKIWHKINTNGQTYKNWHNYLITTNKIHTLEICTFNRHTVCTFKIHIRQYTHSINRMHSRHTLCTKYTHLQYTLVTLYTQYKYLQHTLYLYEWYTHKFQYTVSTG